MTKRHAPPEPKIDLNALLHENPSWEDVVEFFRVGEFDTEFYMAEAIERHLLTEEQDNELSQAELSLVDLLRGHYHFGLESLVQIMLNEWNAKLGFQKFKR